MKIVHLSDLHLTGSEYNQKWGDRVIDAINSIRPEILVITGDLVENGFIHEYETAMAYFNKIDVKNSIVVPGNHDARNEGYKVFEDIFQTRFPRFENEKVAILGIDSSEPDIDEGRVGRENYTNIAGNLSVGHKVKILALHHHLIPIPGTGRERNITRDSGDVLKLCTQVGIKFVLSGHRHRPWIWKLEDTYFITAGTATTRTFIGRSYPSFNILELKEEAILTEFNTADGSSKKILTTVL